MLHFVNVKETMQKSPYAQFESIRLILDTGMD